VTALAKQVLGHMQHLITKSLDLNVFFTRVVNHCETVEGLPGWLPGAADTGATWESVSPISKAKYEQLLGLKSTFMQYLMAIRGSCIDGP
jgi:hypothetical protein